MYVILGKLTVFTKKSFYREICYMEFRYKATLPSISNWSILRFANFNIIETEIQLLISFKHNFQILIRIWNQSFWSDLEDKS